MEVDCTCLYYASVLTINVKTYSNSQTFIHNSFTKD